MLRGWPTSPASTARWCSCSPIAGCGGARQSGCGCVMCVPAASYSVSENAVQLGARHVVGADQRRQGSFGAGAVVRVDRTVDPVHGQGPARFGVRRWRIPTPPEVRERLVHPCGHSGEGEIGSPHTICGIRVPASRCRRESMCWRCNGCSGTQSAKMTLDTYSDLFDDDLDAVAENCTPSIRRNLVSKRCPRATARA